MSEVPHPPHRCPLLLAQGLERSHWALQNLHTGKIGYVLGDVDEFT